MALVLAFMPAIQAQFEGRIITKVEAISVPPEFEDFKSMMEVTSTIYLKGEQARAESSTEMDGEVIEILDRAAGKTYVCSEYMGDRVAVVSDYHKKDPDMITSFLPSAGNKAVAGYKCNKGIYTIESEGEKQDITVWYTGEIQNVYGEMPEVPGFVMELYFSEGDLTLRHSVIEVIKENLSSSLFRVPEGYRVITEEQAEQELFGIDD